MTTRRFSPGVHRAVLARAPRVEKTYGRMVKGDLFKVAGQHGRFRFIGAVQDDRGHVKWIDAFGPIDSGREMLRAFYPEEVAMPSQRNLNVQRRMRAEL